MKRTERIYFLLVGVVLLLLIAGGMLAVVFFDVLDRVDDRLAEAGREGTADIAYGEQFVTPAERADAAEGVAPRPHTAVRGGPSGRERKYELKIPAAPPPAGERTRPAGIEPEARRQVLDAFASVPIFFQEDCEAYGGLFDFRAAGAGFEIQLNPGEICLTLRRPEIFIPEGTNVLRRRAGGTEYSICELSEEVDICMEMVGIQPDVGGWQPPPAARDTNRLYVCENFRRWHQTLPREGRDGAAASAVEERPYPRGEGMAARRTHYFTSGAATPDLPGHASVEYPDIYPGIDLTAYGEQDRLEFVFVAWPGADPREIALRLSGTDRLHLSELGHLVMDFECGRIVQHAPRMYQVINDRPVLIDGGYLIEDNTLRFRVESYDTRQPLVISPVLDGLSYVGGPGFDRAYGIAVDAHGYAYVAGESSSPVFGSDTGFTRQRSNVDIFVTKFRIADSRPIYTSFIGGQSTDRAFDLVADDDGNVYLCGETISPDFPLTNSPALAPTNGAWNGFVAKLSADGATLLYSTVLGGSADDRFYAIALDSSTNIYLAGETSSADLPVRGGFQTRHHGSEWDGFIVRINGRALRPDYATYLGGGGDDTIHAMAVDSHRNIYVAGETSSANLAVKNARQPVYGGGAWDGFAARIPPGGGAIDFLTYVGGGNDDRVNGLAIDGAGNLYLAGETASADFPVSENAIQPAHAGGDWDAFLGKMAPDGSRWIYATYFGGRGSDRAFGVDADASGNAYFAGATTSADLPTASAVQHSHAGGTWDGFAARLNPGGEELSFASYFGGGRGDEFYSVAVDGARNAHFGGVTASTNLPVVNALQNAFGGGGTDAFVARLLPEDQPGPPVRLVSAGGQPDGPDYDFYMGQYEVTNQEFIRFLNNIQANTNNARGSACWFDERGNVYFNPAMTREAHEMFTVQDSRIDYHPARAVGERYAITPRVPATGGSYSNHPIVNVSWYGAVKYCNWLTIDTGRGAGERCYFEGTNAWDWMPVTAAPDAWRLGVFPAEARRAWLDVKGYRLPMDNCDRPPEMEMDDLAIPNREFARFLNHAEAHPETLSGAHMFFDSVGSVWCNPAMDRPAHEMFRIAESRLRYDVTEAAGARYAVIDRTTANGVPYDEFPVSGVTCIGAAKYCNWLTLDRGMDPDDRCYREGTEAFDWAPVTSDPDDWRRGRFSERQQKEWMQREGIRMPINTVALTGNWAVAELRNYVATNAWPNRFNEFYKAAAWSGSTNLSYGFGRRGVTPQDANYLDSGGLADHSTRPVGFFNGTYYTDLNFITHTNENRYGIYDLSGNVTEWLTDPGRRMTLADRACYGGSWMFAMPSVDQRFYVHPHFTDRFRGFRVVTTHTDESLIMIRIPYRICLCGRGTGPGCGEAVAEEEAEEEEEATVLTADESPVDIEGLLYGPEVEEEEEVEEDIEEPGAIDIPETSPSLL